MLADKSQIVPQTKVEKIECHYSSFHVPSVENSFEIKLESEFKKNFESGLKSKVPVR